MTNQKHNQNDHQNDNKNQQYQSLFDKVYLWLKAAKDSEVKSVNQWVNKAEQVLDAAEELSVNEYQLSIKSFKQDLLGFYRHNKNDAKDSLYLTSLGEGMWQHLAKITDQTQIEWTELVDDFDHDGIYRTGDLIGFGQIQCHACSHSFDITHATNLSDCPHCGGSEFSRHSF
ncbi:zinc ribbon-containing protein [Thalassotalea crassostreae]|uniref:zinc ribbon-containing protein n=1 Tax=Thalassotalea crassostreae TaxID=1763536 RepID=UPI0008381F1F|nr:hypothetical protein [Thalassotalea crassostreae]